MANKTSIIIKSIGQDNKSTSRSITDVSKTATNQQLKAFAQALNATSTNTYQGSSRVQTTDLDDTTEKTARTGYILDAGNSTTLTTAVNVNTLGAYDYDNANQLFGFNFTGDNAPIHVITGSDFPTAIMLTAPSSPPQQQQPAGCQHPFTIALFSASDTVSGEHTATLSVEETSEYQALDIIVTITGGNS